MYGQLLGRMAAECRIVRSTSAASWRSNRLAYAAWADWLPDLDPLAMDELSAQRELVRRYVAAYGPVDLEDALRADAPRGEGGRHLVRDQV